MTAIRLVLLNALACAILQFSIAWLFERLDIRRFSRAPVAFQAPKWELSMYRSLGIRRWKGTLPDGALWVGGSFSKARLTHRDVDYLRRFSIESLRGEMAHLCMIFCVPVLFFWNPLWTWPIFGIYALAANLPCIMAQRYNRATLRRIIERLATR